jgi:hypothetical protein
MGIFSWPGVNGWVYWVLIFKASQLQVVFNFYISTKIDNISIKKRITNIKLKK